MVVSPAGTGGALIPPPPGAEARVTWDAGCLVAQRCCRLFSFSLVKHNWALLSCHLLSPLPSSIIDFFRCRKLSLSGTSAAELVHLLDFSSIRDPVLLTARARILPCTVGGPRLHALVGNIIRLPFTAYGNMRACTPSVLEGERLCVCSSPNIVRLHEHGSKAMRKVSVIYRRVDGLVSIVYVMSQRPMLEVYIRSVHVQVLMLSFFQTISLLLNWHHVFAGNILYAVGHLRRGLDRRLLSVPLGFTQTSSWHPISQEICQACSGRCP